MFIRSLVNETRFDTNQIRFVDMIIDHLTKNGTMDTGLLYEQPFNEIHWECGGERGGVNGLILRCYTISAYQTNHLLFFQESHPEISYTKKTSHFDFVQNAELLAAD